MRKRFFQILIVLLVFTHSAHASKKDNPKYNLCVCAIFQNEAPYLREWIEYYRMMGAEHFYLYNDRSTDNFKEVLSPYIKKGIVELKNWPISPKKTWMVYQRKAYQHCFKKCKEKTRWLAVIDIDEYIVPHDADDLISFLEDYEHAGGVEFIWRIFGTSGLWELPKGELMTENFIYRGEKASEYVKSIIRTSRCRHVGVHTSNYQANYPAVKIPLDKAQVNHYWTRDEKFLREVKAARWDKWGDSWTDEKIQHIVEKYNQTEDLCIFRFVPELKERLGISNCEVKNK